MNPEIFNLINELHVRMSMQYFSQIDIPFTKLLNLLFDECCVGVLEDYQVPLALYDADLFIQNNEYDLLSFKDNSNILPAHLPYHVLWLLGNCNNFQRLPFYKNRDIMSKFAGYYNNTIRDLLPKGGATYSFKRANEYDRASTISNYPFVMLYYNPILG